MILTVDKRDTTRVQEIKTTMWKLTIISKREKGMSEIPWRKNSSQLCKEIIRITRNLVDEGVEG